ncbi:hypothetical protein WJX84_004734 [Apatococcus fuscideae]|uniref:Uncharacterized protein n=1 Tax=Apatococcus fuscideae TaxID=2026836 RepID=A0AAW1SM58_9CHLO
MPNAFAMPTQSSSAAATRSPAATSQSAGQPHGYGNEQYNALLPPTNSGPVRGLSLPRTFTNASQESRQLGGHQPHQDPLAEDPMRSFADEENNVFAQVLRTQEMNDPFAQASLQQTQTPCPHSQQCPSSVPAVSLQRLIPHPVRNDHVDRQTITTCVGHLRSSGTGPLQDAAAEQLYEVASNSPGYAASIADQGAIGPLLNALQYSENPETQRASAGIIRAGVRAGHPHADCFPGPRESLSEHSPSLGALTNLARGNPANCNLIVQAGGMQVLLDSCSSQISVAYQQLAAEFIEVLATNSEASCKSLFDHGGLRSLLVWLQSHQAPVRLATLRGVQQLCLSHGMKVKSTFIAMGGMQILIQIPAQDVYEQTALLDLLIVLVERKAYAAEQLCHFSGLAKLASMLSSNSEHASGLAATAIRLVISHKECRAAMKDAMVYHIPERLNAMLRSKSPQLQRPAALLALRLASRQENRHNLQQILGPALQSLSSDASTDHETRQAATEASAAIRSSASLKLSFSHFFKSKS